jgi:4-hydroxy-3-methylbut-2-enyl diphosphate reductase
VLVLGSQNSSNSNRLADIGRQRDRSAYLIDTVSDLHDEWFQPDDVVLVTAGASAPEENVQEVVNHLRTRFGATVETRTVREEHVSFPLPRELRALTVLGK